MKEVKEGSEGRKEVNEGWKCRKEVKEACEEWK